MSCWCMELWNHWWSVWQHVHGKVHPIGGIFVFEMGVTWASEFPIFIHDPWVWCNIQQPCFSQGVWFIYYPNSVGLHLTSWQSHKIYDSTLATRPENFWCSRKLSRHIAYRSSWMVSSKLYLPEYLLLARALKKVLLFIQGHLRSLTLIGLRVGWSNRYQAYL